MRPARPVAAALFALTLGACASSPPMLVALPPAPPSTSVQYAAHGTGPSVLLRRILIPGYLDGAPVVVGRHNNSLLVDDKAEWAERLSDGSARVLRDALAQRLGPSRVLIEGDGRIPDADLTVELVTLDPQAGGRLQLDARWTFLRSSGERASHAGQTRLEVPLHDRTAAEVASATSQALGQLADALATEASELEAR